MPKLNPRFTWYEDIGEERIPQLRLGQTTYSGGVAVEKFAAYEDVAERGRLVILDERLALAISAGARAIENNKRFIGATYVYDVLGDSKELSYYEAANILREAAKAALNTQKDFVK